MTPTQALQVLSQAAAAAPMTLAEHQMAQQALVVLRDAISPKDNMKEDGDVSVGE